MSLKLWVKLLRHSALNVYLNLTHYTRLSVVIVQKVFRSDSVAMETGRMIHAHFAPVAKRNGNTRWRAKSARIDQPPHRHSSSTLTSTLLLTEGQRFQKADFDRLPNVIANKNTLHFVRTPFFSVYKTYWHMNSHIYTEDKSLIIDYENYFSMKHKGKPTHSHINERVNWSYL